MEVTGSSAKRSLWIDVLKGLAILLVVFGHNTDDASFVQCFHMPLFFILSGFCFSPKPIKDYLWKSTNRLMFPYVAFLLIISIPDIIKLIYHREMVTLDGNTLFYRLFYGGVYLKEAYAVFWFITVLWLSSNLFNIYLAYNIGIYLLPIIILVGYIMQSCHFIFPWSIQVVPMATSYIWIGYLLKYQFKETFINGIENNKATYLAIAIAFVCLIYIYLEKI